MRPATNEEAKRIEKAVREGRTRHFADITQEGDPEDDEPMVVEGDVMDVRLGRPDSQPEPERNAPANSNAPSHSDRSETHAEPEAEVRVRFREERERSPDTLSGRILGSRVDGGTACENAETS